MRTQHAMLRHEWHQSFFEDALKAREGMLRTGKVYDAGEVAIYMRAKLARKNVPRPAARRLESYKMGDK